MLERLGCVQLDPIDRFGTNADLVAHARVDGLRRGDWARTMPRFAFEHFAKERCLLPARFFPAYRGQAAEAPWWRVEVRLQRLPSTLLDEVEAEVRARGPIGAAALDDRGLVEPLDWSGWKGTAKATSMALEVLWTQCRIVLAGRGPAGQRIYDVPERALPDHHALPSTGFGPEMVLERVNSAGLLSTAGGPQWSALSALRTDGLPERMVAAGELVRLRLPGSRKAWYTTPALLEAARPPLDPDDRMRVIGPLDALVWDRELLRLLWDFDYVWEIYKPAEQRRWGYYVAPLLHRGRFVGRIEARRRDPKPGERGGLELLQRWVEPGAPFDDAAFALTFDRLATLQGERGGAGGA